MSLAPSTRMPSKGKGQTKFNIGRAIPAQNLSLQKGRAGGRARFATTSRVLCSTGSIAFVSVIIYVFFPTFRSTLTESINMPRPKHLLLCIAFASLISGMSGIELPNDVNWPDGQCLDAAEYAGTCKLWKEGYGKAVPAACRGDCDFEQRGPKCYVTGRGCHCNNPCQCTTNGKTNTIGMQCASLDEL